MHGQHNRCQQMLLFQYAWTAWHITPPAQSAKMTRAEARRQWRKRQKAWKLSSPTVSNHCLLDWQVKGMVDSKEEFAIFVERTFLHDLHFILVCFSLFWHALSCILRTQVSKTRAFRFVDATWAWKANIDRARNDRTGPNPLEGVLDSLETELEDYWTAELTELLTLQTAYTVLQQRTFFGRTHF